MLIFLYGPDTFRSRQKLNEIISSYKKAQKAGLNLKYFDGKALNYQDFKGEFKNISLFAPKKLIVLKNLLSNKEFKENFLKEFKNFIKSQNLILFYEEGEISKDKFFNFLKKNAKSQEFKLLGGEKLKNWIKREFKKYEAKANPGAIEKLIDFVGNNLWQFSNEIKKLASYKNGREIEIQDVELLVRSRIETDIFKTIDFIAQKNKKQALWLLHQHLERGDSPFYLFSMINYQFRNMLQIKDLIERGVSYYDIVSQTKLHPYVIKKSSALTQKFTLEDLKKIYQKIFDTDFKIKTGKIEPETALDLLVAQI